ncbi:MULTISPECIES: replicative DNA helicase [Aminobacterium]|uniref:Replicative DNA helicase n=1 Tax=Aminobacterium colombiense (strain DSM 12261 / ALA-1) TaxID=572547 RepID=D5EG52_AMICL|nr:MULTISPECIES: replicative DNA helicase [Aminobacterium]MDD2378938.1 replicative DNA helicase [Aminobacterium colombiense]ADE57534.1 replicative DNA helicase [Aminobacterium colombiense DSM 12261]MDD3768826.1 replicative DNA helicase [Aminobacterium colombiense]MDD4265137.1 replicative DNA helicase [Aminobacterium colombiense]MDD4585682.1 replicative DNA helicase [Aminobacterium colombiense]
MGENIYNRVPPSSLEAERAVLGACLVDREALNMVMETLVPDDFYDLNHRLAFDIICDMAQRDKPVDALTFLEESTKRELVEKIGGQPFIAGLVNGVTTTANAEYYALIVKDKSIHRRLISAGNTIVHLGYSEEREVDEILEEAEKAVFEIAQKRNRTNFRPISDVLGKTFQIIETQYRKSDQDVTGFSTGFYQFDRMTGGLQPGSLNIIAARPSMGKTALALNIAQYGGVERKEPILIFSLEMSAEQLVQRMLGSEAKVNIHDIRNGSFAEKDWEKLADAAGRLSQAPLFIDDSSMLSTLEFRARARRFKSRFENLGLIVVDYLQLMSFARRIDSKQQEVAEISRALKGVARELDVPVIALSQLSRAVEQRNEKMPQLSDLRDSGAIEQDADLVMLLYRPGYYDTAASPEEEDNRATIRIAKHRNGPTGDVNLVFLKEYTRFVNVERTFM